MYGTGIQHVDETMHAFRQRICTATVAAQEASSHAFFDFCLLMFLNIYATAEEHETCPSHSGVPRVWWAVLLLLWKHFRLSTVVNHRDHVVRTFYGVQSGLLKLATPTVTHHARICSTRTREKGMTQVCAI
eukprot:807605-Amphidinium_carterae.2